MPLLFSYGTLQRDDVQLATFGRLLKGEKDELPGFELSKIKITDPKVIASTGVAHYSNIVFNGRAGSRIPGTILEVTDTELASSDRYEEPSGYKRSAVTLASGKQAWAYAHDASSSLPS